MQKDRWCHDCDAFALSPITSRALPPRPDNPQAPIVVTGASGFIGQHLVRRLVRAGCKVRALTRCAPGDPNLPATGDEGRRAPAGAGLRARNLQWLETPAADAPVDAWEPLTRNALAVVHLAGLAHRPLAADAPERDRRQAALRELRRVNVVATSRLARAAARAGVRDFVFVSSVKAVGERSGEAALDEAAPPRPEDCYGWAKRAAERHLERLADAEPAMRICVLRPPLVYGPGVKGNFAQLQRVVERGWPLPFASVANRRSLIHVGNLVDAMMRILASPATPGGCYHVCDPQPLSTPALIRALAAADGHPARLWPFPVDWLRAIANALGRQSQIERLTGSLVLDESLFRRNFGWTAPRTTVEALADDALAEDVLADDSLADDAPGEVARGEAARGEDVRNNDARGKA